MSDIIELTPSKETYNAIRADVDVAASFRELIDNAIDNAIREGKTAVRVDIEYHTTDSGVEEVVVRDDSGGIERDELDMLFALGESRKDSIRGSIGAFGIGAKKALMRLGRQFSVVSRHRDATSGWGYTIDESWIEQEGQWKVALEEYDLEPETTELRIRSLNFDWDAKRESLRETLSQTYQLYLNPDTVQDTEVELELYIQGERLSPPDRIEFSYTPWGDLYPRRFEGIMITPADIDSHVELRITVGLMATGDESEAGTDVFCQNRLVVHAARGPNGGFDIPRGLPKFRPESHKRLKIQVEFTTDGDAADLPWNADKSRVRSDHPVMREARQWIREIADRYMQARYGDVPIEFHRPYTADSEYAANGGAIAGPFDYTQQFQAVMQGKRSTVDINETPRAALSTISKMQQTAEAHAKLGIRCESVGWFEEWMLPTYEALLASAVEEAPFETLTHVDQTIPDVTEVDVDGLIEEIESLARKHARAGYRYTDLKTYERPRYEQTLERRAAELDVAVEDLEATDELDPTASANLPETGHSGGDPPRATGQVGGDNQSGASNRETSSSGRQQAHNNENHQTEILAFGPFDAEELATLERHLGDLDGLSPDERRERLVEYLTRLDTIGIDPEAVRES